jgi:hypothetical protein
LEKQISYIFGRNNNLESLQMFCFGGVVVCLVFDQKKKFSFRKWSSQSTKLVSNQEN